MLHYLQLVFPNSDGKISICNTKLEIKELSKNRICYANTSCVILNVKLHLATQVGSDDLVNTRPEVVGSPIEDMVRHLLSHYAVRIVVLCQVASRITQPRSTFNAKAMVLNQYTRVVLEPVEQAICWTHKGFSNPSATRFLPDGVHFNARGQYALYRSYRGALIYVLKVDLY